MRLQGMTTGSGNENLDIYGNVLIKGSLFVTMNGAGAALHINDDAGCMLVEVKGLFHATMLGSGASIVAGATDDSGSSPVKFDLGVTLLGGFGAGATFEREPGITTPFILPAFFTVVSS